ncbi:MAG TPA: site-2 protease family protein [Pyrinomonadaceae bacterium]|nr:site-2 protease family protein [Pyrinomonadaceae bacterium]
MEFPEYLKRQAVLVEVAGIPVRADFRWFLVVGLMSAITAASVEKLVGNIAGSIVLGIGTTLLFFASIFVHEFAHALAARMEKLDVLEIVLHPFGGLTRFKHPPETPRAEFRIAIAGPAASFVLTLIFVGLMELANSGGLDILWTLLSLLALSNFLLAVFNLFPGYPLDGGRVLRAYLWKQGKDLTEATILTGRCGKLIAGGLIVIGLLFIVLYEQFFGGFWVILAGIFLYDSARTIIQDIEKSRAVVVDDIMLLPRTIDPDETIQKVIDQILPMYRLAVFPVARDKQLYGMLVLEDLKRVNRSNWRGTLVRDVMRAVTTNHFVETGTAAVEANGLAISNGCGAVAVIDHDGKLAGFILAV